MSYSIEEQQQEAAQKQEAARIKASQDFGRLDRMMANEDLAWLLETHLAPMVEKERAAAHNLSLGRDKCWEHLQRHEIASAIVTFLASEHARLKAMTLVVQR